MLTIDGTHYSLDILTNSILYLMTPRVWNAEKVGLCEIVVSCNGPVTLQIHTWIENWDVFRDQVKKAKKTFITTGVD